MNDEKQIRLLGVLAGGIILGGMLGEYFSQNIIIGVIVGLVFSLCLFLWNNRKWKICFLYMFLRIMARRVIQSQGVEGACLLSLYLT